MTYTFDMHRPVWVDSVRGELVDTPDAHAETKPGKLTESDLDRAIAQKRRDTICAASQAPRIPRLHRLVGAEVPACRSECKQGRGLCATPGDCLVRRLEPLPQEPAGNGRALIWLLCLAVLLVMVPALIFGVNWADLVSLLAAIGGAL